MSIESFYNKKMLVKVVKTTGRGGTGGVKETKTAVTSNEPCALRLLSENEIDILGQQGIRGTHRITCRAGVPVSTNDEITIDSNRYDITSIDDPFDLGRFLNIICILRT